jgi:DNA-binding transcriptional regulator YiaG
MDSVMDSANLSLLIEARDAAKSGRGERLRRAAGLSQGEVAAAIGVSYAAVSRWEQGSRRPRGAPAIAWARLLRELANHVSSPMA